MLLPTLLQLAGYISRGVEKFSSLNEGTKRVIITVALLAAAIGPVLLVLGLLLSSVAKIAAGIATLKVAIVALKGKIIALKSALVIGKAVFLALISPIGLVVLAVAALAAGVFMLIRHWGAVKGFFITLWAEVRRIFSSAVTAALGFVQSLWDGVVSRFNSMVSGIRNIVAGVTDAIAAPFRRASKIVSDLTSEIGGFLQRINPFARQSPSLVDSIKAGVRMIQQEYGKLENLRLPTLAAATMPAMHPVEASIPSLRHRGSFGAGMDDITSTVGQAVYKAMRDVTRATQIEQGREGQRQEVVLEIDGARIGRVILPALIREGQRTGMPVIRLAEV
ncbi:MAG: hypothetical protein DDT20_00887 [Firmicutes bacterium]|nr:hypothetical protein [Bacillota bacterium]